MPVRPSETAGSAGKQPYGSARTRAVKVVVIRTAEHTKPQARPARDFRSIRHLYFLNIPRTSR